MNIQGKTILITGATRGMGRALVEEALKRGAKRVYAAARTALAHSDERVTPVIMDVTNAAQIRQARGNIESLDILINNAGLSLIEDSVSDRSALEQHLAVNFFGLYDVTQAFVPLLIRSRGVLINNISLSAVAAVPFAPTYSISKAAALSLTQSLRATLSGQGVKVHSALTGPVDTDMTRHLAIPKASPQSVAQAIFDAVVNGEETILPDPLSTVVAEPWRSGAPKEVERQFAAAYTQQNAVQAA